MLSAVLGGAASCVKDSAGLPTWDPSNGRRCCVGGQWWLARCRSSRLMGELRRRGTRLTSVHSQTQFIGSKNSPSIYQDSTLAPNSPYRDRYSENPSHPNMFSLQQQNRPPNSNRVPSHNDPAKTRPPIPHASPVKNPRLATKSFSKTRRPC